MTQKHKIITNILPANVRATRIENFARSGSPEPIKWPTLTAAAIAKPKLP